MDIIILAKIFGAVICLVISCFSYRGVKGKKPIRQGDNIFFNEIKNGISITDYYSSWRLIIISLLCAVVLIIWAFE
jgi:hypothetical protein